QEHAQQLRDAIEWCKTAADNIIVMKDLITSNVTAAQQEIQSIEKTAARNNENPDGAIKTLVEREYKENFNVVNTFAMASGANLAAWRLSPLDLPGKPGHADDKGSTQDNKGPSKEGLDYVVKPGSVAAGLGPAPGPAPAPEPGPAPVPPPMVEPVINASK